MNNRLWFKAKNYGWGWQPATWQGWLALLLYLVIVLGIVFNIENRVYSALDVIMNITLPILAATGLLLMICWGTGEKPTWRWGKK